jgi:outer membrane protein
MEMKKILFYFAMGALSPLSASSESIQIPYESLRAHLESRNLKIEALKLNVEAAKTRQENYLSRSFLPSVELHLDQETFKKGLSEQKTQPSFGIEAKVNLYNSHRDSIESDIRSMATQLKETHFHKSVFDELFEAREAYWDILYTEEKIALQESISKVNTTNFDSALKRIRNGVATESDKMEFEIKATELKQELDRSKLKLNALLQDLRLILNIKKESSIQLTSKLDHIHDFESLMAHSHSDHDLNARENEIYSKITDLQSQNQARVWWPKIDAVAGVRQLSQLEEPEAVKVEDRKESYIGIRLSMSLPEGMNFNKESKAQAKESLSFQKLSEHQHLKIHNHVDSEIAELKLLHNQVHEAEDNIVRAEKYYKLTQSEYSRGVKNSPDMLSATEKLFDVKLKRLDILKDFNQKLAHVLTKIQK